MSEPRHIGHRARILAQAIRQAIDRKLVVLDLTGQQSFIIRYLYERRGEIVYPKDIEKRFSLTHPTVSGLLQRLEHKGFVTCAPDSHDRRFKRLELTAKAEECQKQIFQHIQTIEETMTAGMSEEECDTLMRLLDLAAENLNNSMNLESQKEESKPCSNA